MAEPADSDPTPDPQAPDSARYPRGSTTSGKPADINGYPAPDIDGYPDPDIDGYPDSDIDGYPASGSKRTHRPDIRRYQDARPGPGQLSDAYQEVLKDQPLFKDSGFDSIDDYLEYLDDLARERLGLPAYHPGGLKRIEPADSGGSRQVGLRMPEMDFKLLQAVADEHGLTPATTARMIVVRAVRAAKAR